MLATGQSEESKKYVRMVHITVSTTDAGTVVWMPVEARTAVEEERRRRGVKVRVTTRETTEGKTKTSREGRIRKNMDRRTQRSYLSGYPKEKKKRKRRGGVVKERSLERRKEIKSSISSLYILHATMGYLWDK